MLELGNYKPPSPQTALGAKASLQLSGAAGVLQLCPPAGWACPEAAGREHSPTSCSTCGTVCRSGAARGRVSAGWCHRPRCNGWVQHSHSSLSGSPQRNHTCQGKERAVCLRKMQIPTCLSCLLPVPLCLLSKPQEDAWALATKGSCV